MARKRSWIVAAGVALVGVLSVGAGPAGAVIPSGNLLANPGAEAGPAGAGGSSATGVPGWTVGSAVPAVVRYGTAGGFPTSDGSAGGSQFFAGGNSAALGSTDHSTLFQSIDVHSVSEVAAGGVRATMTACLGGYADQDDYAEIKFNADEGGATTTMLGDIKGPSAAQRGGKTEFWPETISGTLPASTHFIDAYVFFYRVSGAGLYDDGYADDVQLALSAAGTGAAIAPLPCAQPASNQTGSGGQGQRGGTAGGKVTSATGTNPAAGIARVGKRLTLKGSDALVELRCTLHDGNCKGTLSLAATGLPKAHKSAAAKKAKATKLGSAKFTIAAGKTKTIKVKLGHSIRKRLGALSKRRLKKLKITATAKIGKQTTKFSLGAVRRH